MPKPAWQEPAEQVGHVALGVLAGLSFGLLLIWWREWVLQWPPGDPATVDGVEITQLDRVADTKRDLLFFDIGYTAGQVGQFGLVWWLL